MRTDRKLVLAGLAGLVLAGTALHVFLLLTTAGAAYDINAYKLQAYAALHGLNVYKYTVRYPYPPLWIWIVREMAQLSDLGIPFAIAIRLPATVADLGTTLLLGWHQVRQRGWTAAALVVPALWALNPVAAVIAAGHGQFDGLPVFFTVLSVVLTSSDRPRDRYLAALALGLGIALKGYPVLLLPYLAFTTAKGRRLAVSGLALVPVLICMAVYVAAIGFSPTMITHVIAYTSTPDLGWSAMLRFTLATLPRPVEIGVMVLVADLVVFWALRQSRMFPTRPELAAAALFALFYVVSPRGSVQYLVWGLPFMVLSFRRLSVLYSLAALTCLVGYYSMGFHGALPGSPWNFSFKMAAFVYLAGLVAVIVTNFAVLASSWRARDRTAQPRASARSLVNLEAAS